MGPPHRETGNPSCRRVVCAGGGALFPEEAEAGPLQSLIKLLEPQTQGWELGVVDILPPSRHSVLPGCWTTWAQRIKGHNDH